ncbi:MAG: hypothetical protein WDN04_14145 [Rhodospirillales bacterium]
MANYRIYNDDSTTTLGKIGTWFEDAYTELSAKPMYKGVVPFEASQVHNGYFSQDKKGRAKDTRGNTADDEDTYALIMRDKERSARPPGAASGSSSATPPCVKVGITRTSFRFAPCGKWGPSLSAASRSAVGFVCQSTRTASACNDEQLNRLTVIASESYKDFAAALQTEYENDFGMKIRPDRVSGIRQASPPG